jgi:hypothetical protein
MLPLAGKILYVDSSARRALIIVHSDLGLLADLNANTIFLSTTEAFTALYSNQR